MKYSNLIDKVEKQIDSLKNKIDGLSGEYLTNTHKRQAEQRIRDRKKELYSQRLEFLVYHLGVMLTRKLTAFETALLTGAFYEDMRGLLIRRQYKIQNPTHNVDQVTLTSSKINVKMP